MDVCICVEVKGQLVGDIPLLMPCESRDRSVFRLDNKHPYTPEAISAGIFLMVHYIWEAMFLPHLQVWYLELLCWPSWVEESEKVVSKWKKKCPIDSVKCRLKGIYLIFLWHQFWWLTKPHCVEKCLDLDWKPLWSPCRIYCLPHGSRDPCRIHQLGKWSSPTQTHPIHSS